MEETLNGLLDAEADEMCQAQRYERAPERVDTRAGHYRRKLQTQAGEVELKMPKLRRQTFETAIIERYPKSLRYPVSAEKGAGNAPLTVEQVADRDCRDEGEENR